MQGVRKKQMDEKKVQKYFKKGRGTGVENDYKPWLEVYDVPSLGRVHRTPSLTTGRIYHLMSDGEEAFFLMCDWADHIVDIREQFPLDREVTFRIARELGIRHPMTRDGTPYVMTCDFLLTAVENGKRKLYARTFKRSEDLRNKRVLEKFEIERVYWKQSNIDWGIVTEKELDIVLVRNIEEILGFKSLTGLHEEYTGAFQHAANVLFKIFFVDGTLTLRNLCKEIDASLGVKIKTAEPVAKYLIANKILCTDMHAEEFLIKRKVVDFWFHNAGGKVNVIE